MTNIVSIAYITDSKYIMPTYISVLSLKLSKNKTSSYNVYLIISDEKIPDLSLFNCIEDDNFKIIPILKDTIGINDFSNQYLHHFSPAIFIKLELEKILTDCSKVLFLDADVIVRKDLTDIYNTNLDNYYIAGCLDPFVIVNHLKKYNIKNEKYINVGVMLLNLDLIRQNKFFEQVTKYYIENGQSFEYPEQDAINNLIGDKIKILSPIYNWLVCNVRYPRKSLKRFYKFNKTEDFNDNNLAIIHYAGIKPWLYTNVYYHKYWEDVYFASELKDTPLHRKNKYPLYVRLYVHLRSKFRYFKDFKFCKEVGLW